MHGKVETGVVGGHDVVDTQAERLDAEQGAVVGDEQQAVETGQATVPWKMKTQILQRSVAILDRMIRKVKY